MRSGQGDTQFQSLSGFLMSCNPSCPVTASLYTPLFQSLSGFLMSCNGPPPVPLGADDRFQSLSGFLMSCNGDMAAVVAVAVHRVSIPIGFSNEL